MACYHPLAAVVLGLNPENGKKILKVIKNSFRKRFLDSDLVKLPCGNCIGCREDRAKAWAIRCVHEASLYDRNCFITLTFNNEHLNPKGSLVKADFQRFMKRLRQFACRNVFDPKKGSYVPLKRKDWLKEPGIRYYHCGEYGTQLGRPHHHACLFNFDFSDRVLFREKEGSRLYRSKVLESLWADPRTGSSLGFSTIGDVTFESAAYVARYIVKKINGELAPSHYQGRLPEYTTMSRRPGIGKDWFKKYKDTDIDLAYREGFIIMNGKTYKIPKFYDVNFELTNPEDFALVKEVRKDKALSNPDNSPSRLKARELVHRARHEQLVREIER